MLESLQVQNGQKVMYCGFPQVTGFTMFLMLLLGPVNLFSHFFVYLLVYALYAAPTVPCITIPAPLYGLKSFSMHLKIFMNLNTGILLELLSASVECCRNQPIEPYLQTPA